MFMVSATNIRDFIREYLKESLDLMISDSLLLTFSINFIMSDIPSYSIMQGHAVDGVPVDSL